MRINSQQLWKERFISYSKEMQKYLRYIFNGHLVFVMVLGFGGAAYYYSNWVKTLESTFPAPPIMTLVLAFFVTSSPIYTFLKDADTVFIISLERQLKGYFTQSILLSWVMQGYILLFILAAFMPMYAKVTGANLNDFIVCLVLLLILKGFNLFIHWYTLKYQEFSTSRNDAILRFFMNIAFLYFMFSKASMIYMVVVGFLFVALLLYYRNATSQKTLKWERLVSLEKKRMMSFYRLANLFTDVPNMGSKVARRRWLDGLLAGIPFNQKSTYSYLYARTLFRANDYFGLWIRLTIIGSIILTVMSNLWAYIFVAILFLYMTAIQLLPVWREHEWKIWVNLYPVSDKLRESAVVKWITYFLIGEAFVFFLVLLGKTEWQAALMTIAAVAIFILGFRRYATKKIRTF